MNTYFAEVFEKIQKTEIKSPTFKLSSLECNEELNSKDRQIVFANMFQAIYILVVLNRGITAI